MAGPPEPAPAKAAVVTGAAQGIGLAIARRLEKDGVRLIAMDVNGPALQAAGLRAELLEADVSDPDAHQVAVQAALDSYGRLDGYINNAGIIGRAALLEATQEEVRRVVEVNLLGAYWGVQAAAAHMAAEGRGHIINISSGHAVIAGYDRAAYAMTKAGIEALTRNAAVELGARGVLVNAVAPGFTFTEMSRGSLVGDRLRIVESRLPIRRVAESEEVAAAVSMLLAGELSYMTGQVLRIDGGWSNSDIRYSDLKPEEIS